MKNETRASNIFKSVNIKMIGMGIISVISTSKIKKITEIK